MRILLTLLLAFTLGACASAPRKSEDAERRETAQALRAAIETGRVIGAADPAFTPLLEEASLAWLLYRGPAPMAGARRLLDMRERGQDLAGVFLSSPAASKLPAVTDSEAFRSGQFFNSYDPALFRPFFRHALWAALREPGLDDERVLGLLEPLELALRFTPRYAGVYPNLIDDDLKRDLRDYLQRQPSGTASDRFRMLLLWDERNGVWEAERKRIDAEMERLAEASQDELLKLELKDALAAPRAKPNRAFWMSLAVPGLGQIAHGDIQGGILLGGLTFSAWAWMGSKLAQSAGMDAAGRRIAYGDAAWAGGLALLGHGFTAMNAAEQARFINIVVEWDLLSKDRLTDDGR